MGKPRWTWSRTAPIDLAMNDTRSFSLKSEVTGGRGARPRWRASAASETVSSWLSIVLTALWKSERGLGINDDILFVMERGVLAVGNRRIVTALYPFRVVQCGPKSPSAHPMGTSILSCQSQIPQPVENTVRERGNEARLDKEWLSWNRPQLQQPPSLG